MTQPAVSRAGAIEGAVEPESGAARANRREREQSSSPFVTWEDWREYVAVVTWLVPHVYRHARGTTLSVLFLSITGVAARAGTIGTVLLYVRARSTGSPIELLGISLPSEASVPIYLLWGGAAVLFASIAVAASYYGDKLIFDIAGDYANSAIQRVLRHAAAGRQLELPEDLKSETSDPIGAILKSDIQRIIRLVVQTLSIVLPFITLLVAVAVLIFANALLTAALIPIVALYSLAVAVINRRLLRDSQERRFAQKSHRQDLGGIFETLRGTRYPTAALPEWLTSYPRESWMDKSIGALRGIRLARRRIRYIRDGFQGIALLVVVMVFGTTFATTDDAWAMLLTYLVALRYATTSLDRAFGFVTAANRHIPHVRRYVAFMRSEEENERSGVGAADGPGLSFGPPRFEVTAPPLPGSLAQLVAKPGEAIFCHFPGLLDNQQLASFCLALTGGDPVKALELESELFFLAGIQRLPERPLWKYRPTAGDPSALRVVTNFLHELGLQREFEQHLGDFNRILTPDLDRQLSPGLRYAMRLVPGVLAGAHVAILNWDGLEAIDEPLQRRILAALGDQVVLLVSRDPAAPAPGFLNRFMVVDSDGIRGIGDSAWYNGLDREALRESLAPDSEEAWRRSRDPDDLDDLDDDDEDG